MIFPRRETLRNSGKSYKSSTTTGQFHEVVFLLLFGCWEKYDLATCESDRFTNFFCGKTNGHLLMGHVEDNGKDNVKDNIRMSVSSIP